MVVLLLLLVPFFVFGGDVDLKAEMDQDSLFALTPIEGAVMITHAKEDKIDVNSFTLDGKPLSVDLEKEVHFSSTSPVVISIYHFSLPPEEAGNYTLNSIGVRVGSKNYKTDPVYYSIKASTSDKSFEKASLKLEMNVEANKPFYPGQRAKFIYRYIYTGDIEMTKEDLPLLTPKGFKKIGEERVTDSGDAKASVREILLEVEALEPGDYSFPASSIEGKAMTPSGTYDKLHAETPPLTITVAPFPKVEQPVGFEGAYGTFSIQAALLSAPSVKVGDRLTVAVDIYGNPAELTNVKLPKIFCQPGFSGMFIKDDLPVAGKIEGDHKRFILYLRPLNNAAAFIPSVRLSFFNPLSSKYEFTETKPIPIKVAPVDNVLTDFLGRQIAPQPEVANENWTALIRQVAPISVSKSYTLKSYDLYQTSSWYLLLVIPCGVFLWGCQFYAKNKRGVK